MSTSTESVPVPEWDLGDRLNKALRVSGISVGDMALYLGVHRNTVSAWINGRTPISGPAIRVWADRTGVDYGWLLSGHPSGPPSPPGQPLPGPQYATVRHLRPAAPVAEHPHPEDEVDDSWVWLANKPVDDGCPQLDSNQRPADYKAAA